MPSAQWNTGTLVFKPCGTPEHHEKVGSWSPPLEGGVSWPYLQKCSEHWNTCFLNWWNTGTLQKNWAKIEINLMKKFLLDQIFLANRNFLNVDEIFKKTNHFLFLHESKLVGRIFISPCHSLMKYTFSESNDPCVSTIEYLMRKKFNIQVIEHTKHYFHITSTTASNFNQSKISCIFWEVQPFKAETSLDSR